MNREQAIDTLKAEYYGVCYNCDSSRIYAGHDSRRNADGTEIYFVFIECENCEWSSDEMEYTPDDETSDQMPDYLTSYLTNETPIVPRDDRSLWCIEAAYHQSMIAEE